jgi:hypothetical protein
VNSVHKKEARWIDLAVEGRVLKVSYLFCDDVFENCQMWTVGDDLILGLGDTCFSLLYLE